MLISFPYLTSIYRTIISDRYMSTTGGWRLSSRPSPGRSGPVRPRDVARNLDPVQQVRGRFRRSGPGLEREETGPDRQFEVGAVVLRRTCADLRGGLGDRDREQD